MIRDDDQEMNNEQIEQLMMEKLRQLNHKYGIKWTWMLQFINQNLYLSNLEIIEFADSCQEIELQTGDRFVSNILQEDFIYCLLSGRAKIVKQDLEQNNWELKRLKLVMLHNYRVSKRDETFRIVADSDCQFVKFRLPFSREQHRILILKRSFLCSFFDLDFNRLNFEVLDLFETVKYRCGEKISIFKDRLIIVKDGMCTYAYKHENLENSFNNKIALLDRNGPFVLNTQNFSGQEDLLISDYEISVKQAEVVCFQAPITKVLQKSFYYPQVVKKLRQFCAKQNSWVHNMIESKKKDIQNSQKTIRKIAAEDPQSLTLSRFKNIQINKRLFDNQEQQLNLLTKTISKSRLVNRQKRVSLQIQLGKQSLTPIPTETIANKLTIKFQPRTRSRQTKSALRILNDPQPAKSNQMIDKVISFKLLNQYHETINKKKKILNSKLKSSSTKSINLFDQTLNTQTKSFKLRMIHTGIKIIPTQGIKHTSSVKKLQEIKTKCIEKIERSNRIGMQCMVIHSDSQEEFFPINQQYLQTKRNSFSTKRLSNAEYHNYLVHGDINNPKQEPLQKVHQRIKILSKSHTSAYNHSQHLKSKSKLHRYSTNKKRPLEKL